MKTESFKFSFIKKISVLRPILMKNNFKVLVCDRKFIGNRTGRNVFKLLFLR